MKSAHQHLEQVIALSRESWKAIAAETDDDREWIPGSKQTGVIPNVRVSAEMITGWHDFLNEAEQILAGKKLVPHWRFTKGFNFARICMASMAVVAVADLALGDGDPIVGYACLCAAAVLAVRLARWQTVSTIGTPIQEPSRTNCRRRRCASSW